MSGQAFGVIGLEVMGRNVAQNVERNGFPVAVYNRTWEKTQDFLDGPAKGKNFKAGKTEAEFVALLERPRRILVLVKAGKPVDLVVDALKPHLQEGDIIIDGGNSLYTDTERRVAALAPTGIKFFGMGVSGGEEGALWGPSLMPGGDMESYKHLEPILTKISAKAYDGAPCVTYCGARGAGHFVKMTHNGIEYGDMQLISEAYDLLKNVGGIGNAQLQDIFNEWNQKGSELRSFLIEITSKVINFADPTGSGKLMVDVIQDVVGMKGTGTWTIQAALNLTVPVPTMAAAVDGREMSMLKSQRVEAEKLLAGPKPAKFSGDLKAFINDVRAALYCSKICSYAQGMAMLAAANQPKNPDGSGGYDYGMHLEELAKIWRAGCIIRADFLDDITKAFKADPKLPNLLLAAKFKDALASRQDAWRRVIVTGVQNGVATPAFSASLAYYDAYRRARLPGNLIQAQRDFFGGHTYMRTDKTPAGPYHMEWAPGGKETLVVEGKSRTK
ncbi:MAG TPA: NADP-dependent phosphogluconate dehydrogenase [Tepidisphaeraceae bacterium]|nr:NADP-dependent phosphogluconate dehydrogenase [Tepidisphaeraceae bacterium]